MAVAAESNFADRNNTGVAGYHTMSEAALNIASSRRNLPFQLPLVPVLGDAG